MHIIFASIINWILGILALICTLGIIIFPILAVVMGIIEGKNPNKTDQKHRWKKTIISLVLFSISFGGLIIVFVSWGLAVFLVNGFDVPNQ